MKGDQLDTSRSARLEAARQARLAIIGLGYVGLPLAVEFGKHRKVVGFDINAARIAALKAGHDATLEVSDEELREATGLHYTTDLADLATCNVYIVTVPTPIDEHKRPDLSPLIKASGTIGKVLKKGDIVIYEFDGLSRRHGRRLRAGARSRLRPEIQRRFLRRLQPGAHQPGRQAAPRLDDQERSPLAPRQKSPNWSISSTARSLSPAPTRRRASEWPKPPR